MSQIWNSYIIWWSRFFFSIFKRRLFANKNSKKIHIQFIFWIMFTTVRHAKSNNTCYANFRLCDDTCVFACSFYLAAPDDAKLLRKPITINICVYTKRTCLWKQMFPIQSKSSVLNAYHSPYTNIKIWWFLLPFRGPFVALPQSARWKFQSNRMWNSEKYTWICVFSIEKWCGVVWAGQSKTFQSLFS